MKAMTEGGRAFAIYVGQQLDLAKFSDNGEEQQRAAMLVALLTPVAKAFFTDTKLDSCVLGQQVFGGHGYIREWGQEQLVRDVRIAQIYEGTNGIQALDLLARKVVGNGGAALRVFTHEIEQFTQQKDLPYSAELAAASHRLEDLSDWLMQQAAVDANLIGASCVEYLQLFGYVAYAYMWARTAQPAGTNSAQSASFYQAKQKLRGFSSAAYCRASTAWKPASVPGAIRCTNWMKHSSEFTRLGGEQDVGMGPSSHTRYRSSKCTGACVQSNDRRRFSLWLWRSSQWDENRQRRGWLISVKR